MTTSLQTTIASTTLLLLMATTSTADLVAHWPLNEGSGDVFGELVNGNDGFLPEEDLPEIEWASEGPPGIQDVSVEFLGDIGPSYIATPYEGIVGDEARTVALWMRADPQSKHTALVSWGGLAAGAKWHFRINQGSNSLRTEFQGGQNFSGIDVMDGEWHFVASVLPDGGEGEDILHYVDGELDEQIGGTSLPIDTLGLDDGGFPVHLGWAAGHAERWFTGNLADVRIYDEALDEAALQAIMSGEGINNGILGDFNGDGVVDAVDMDLLSADVRAGLNTPKFDLDGDGVVGTSDRQAWVSDVRNTWFGDSNLDGEFNSTDFVVVFAASEYEDELIGNSTWATGDWNGDTEFNSSDFVVAFSNGGYEMGPRPQAVPEPSSVLVVLTAFVLTAIRRRQ